MSISTPLQGRFLLAVSIALPSLLAAGAAQAQLVPSSARLSNNGGINNSGLSTVRKPLSTVDASLLGRLGCPACRSGLDGRFNQRQDVINPDIKVQPGQVIQGR